MKETIDLGVSLSGKTIRMPIEIETLVGMDDVDIAQTFAVIEHLTNHLARVRNHSLLNQVYEERKKLIAEIATRAPLSKFLNACGISDVERMINLGKRLVFTKFRDD